MSSAHTVYSTLSRRAEIIFALASDDIFSSRCASIAPDARRAAASLPQNVDPPQHGRYRLLVDRAISSVTRQLRDVTPERVSALFDRRPRQCEFVADVALPLAISTTMDILGLPAVDHAMIQRFLSSTYYGRTYGVSTDGTRPKAPELSELYEYFVHMLSASTVNTGLIGLLRDEFFGVRRPARLAVGTNLCQEVLFAGVLSTAYALSNVVGYLAANPYIQRRRVWSTSQVFWATEELLRWDSPVSTARVTRAQIDMGALKLPRDSVVLLDLGAANRDEGWFPGASSTVNLSRRPNRHLAFGYGTHRCPGAGLARLQLRSVVSKLHEGDTGYVLSGELERLRAQIGGVVKLPLTRW